MKPFITDAFKNGKFVLPFQVEGLPTEDFGKLFEGACVLAYGLPESHDFQTAWLFRLVLDSGWIVDFSSACTGVGGWQEIGSLNLAFARGQPERDPVKWMMTALADFQVASVDRLIYEDGDVYTECGLLLKDRTDREVVVATGTAPGSVSILVPLSANAFQPEFLLEKLQRRPA